MDASAEGGGSGGDGATSTPTVPAPNGGAFSFEAIAATAAAAGSKAVVVWTVTFGSPDYNYAFGGGTTSGKQVFVSFSAAPPAEALNDGKLGVGIVAIVDGAFPVSEGKIDGNAFEAAAQLLSPEHAIIFRASTEVATKKGWDTSFPQGYSCGRCVHAPQGFDSYAVEDCSKVTLQAGGDFCNWT